jgi:hypothetical protein
VRRDEADQVEGGVGRQDEVLEVVVALAGDLGDATRPVDHRHRRPGRAAGLAPDPITAGVHREDVLGARERGEALDEAGGRLRGGLALGIDGGRCRPPVCDQRHPSLLPGSWTGER